MSVEQGGAPHSQTTPKQVIIALVVGLLAPILAIVLIVQLVVGMRAGQVDMQSSAMSDKAVAERLRPVGVVAVSDPNAPKVEKTGLQIYNEGCAACHGAGALGAPKPGDQGAWSQRIAQGYDTLVQHAVQGIRAMPAKGGNPDLSDTEVARAVVYMANQSGANFPEPPASGGATAQSDPGTQPGAAGTMSADQAAAQPAPGQAPDQAQVSNQPQVSDQTQAGQAPMDSAQSSLAPMDSAQSGQAQTGQVQGGQGLTPDAPVQGSGGDPRASAAEQSQMAGDSASVPANGMGSTQEVANGEEVYNQVCAACHNSGVMGSPKRGDQAAWSQRVAQGRDTLVRHAIQGIRAMPAKGGNPALSDAQVAAAVDYMVGGAR